MKLLRIVPDDTKFGFMRFRRISFPFSAVLSVLSVVLFLTMGMNFGIDFRGGTLVELHAKSGVADLAKVRQTLEGMKLGDVEVQGFGNAADASLRVGLQEGGGTAQTAVVDKVKAALEGQYTFPRVDVVGPRVSAELVQSGTIGIVVSVATVLFYLWFRFEWQFAVGAVIATLHDLVLTIGFFSLTRLEFDMTSIAAILTIVGYSLNDTVVVLDRIREMMRKYKKMSISDMLNISINTTLSRTIMTSLATFLALVALVGFGGHVIRSFSLAMMFGVVIGTYSSIFIAAPVLIYLGVRTEAFSGAKSEPEPAKPAKAVA
ncbi:MAG: protein translocase subunit SecF [Hyphomicrobiales bacterium]|nr:protein translocase subunit SecF [Hyphomicrobiales bacterium]MDE2114846.1 protein translocase subunit SecF [Hyphomicrobiales bacterium]